MGLDKTAVRAEGATITDSDGKTYIDCTGGYGIFNLGHNHLGIIQALKDQLSECQLFTKPLITEIQIRAAEALAAIAPGDLKCSVMYNSGSEAIDNVLKLVRLHRGPKKIITAQNSFHGHTFGALSATGIASFKRSFKPWVPGFVHVPFGDAAALERAVDAETAAVMLEPIQHEAGVVLPPDDYFHQVRRICNEHDLILIFDEIKTGFGKTGKMFACEHFEVFPDILVVGKSLGGGLVPLGAIIAKSSFWKRFGLSFTMSASSFAGNGLACRAAWATIHYIQKDDLLNHCQKMGTIIMPRLKELVEKYSNLLKSVDGLGLLIGINAKDNKIALELVRHMIQQGILILTAFANPSALMVEPPLVISLEQVEKFINALATACEKVSNLRRLPED